MKTSQSREPWNKGKLIAQKPPLRLKDIWAIRIHLQLSKRIRDLAMFIIVNKACRSVSQLGAVLL